MNDEKLDVVREYLNAEFGGSAIDEQYDFDRSAQTFRIRTERDVLLLKVGEEFLSDNGEEQIRAHLQKWDVADLLRSNKEFGIFVGSNAPLAFGRYV